MKPKSKTLLLFAEGLVVFCYRVKQYNFADIMQELDQLNHTYIDVIYSFL